MDISKMKQDINEAISNNIKEYKSNYNLLVFDKDNKEYIKSFFFMKELKIKIQNNKLLYNIKLDENVINKISNKDKKIIQKKYLEKRVKNLFAEKLHFENIINYCKNTLIEHYVKDNKEYESSKIKKSDISKMNLIKQILKEYFNIESTLKKGECFLFLESVQQEINFNKGMLSELEDIFNQIDVFSITPKFYGEKIIGIRLFWAIDLTNNNLEVIK